MTDTDDKVMRANEIAEQIKPLLAGQGPEVQGAVLVALLGIWVAGHRPDMRPAVLGSLIASARQYAALHDKEVGLWNERKH